MNVTGFLYVSLGSSTVQLHDSLGSRCACTCSKAGFSSQNGVRAKRVLPKNSVLLWAKWPNGKDIHKEMLPVSSRKCLLHKAIHTWVEKFSQGCSNVADDAQPGHPVETVTEATVQWVHEMIRANRRIMIDSVATALRCSHDLAYNIMHDHLKILGKCAHGGCPENWTFEKKWTELVCPCKISYGMQVKEKIWLTWLLICWKDIIIKNKDSRIKIVSYTIKN
jgi:hypothetical protein